MRRFRAALGLVLAISTLGVAEAATARPLAASAEARPASGAVELERAVAQRRAAEARLGDVQRRIAELRDRVAELDARDAGLTSELASARREIREYAVAAFIDGGRSAVADPAADRGLAGWRREVLAEQARRAAAAVDRVRALRVDDGDERAAAAAELDRLVAIEAEARSDVIQAAAVERDAEAAVAAARAEQRRRADAAAAASRASTTTTTSSAPPARPAQVARSVSARRGSGAPAARPAPSPAPVVPAASGPAGATPAEAALLAKIRQCESGGNYAAVSPSGQYRGAYQFSLSTWRAMGGSGDPAAASPAEQDQRALQLLRTQGPRAWPSCSR